MMLFQSMLVKSPKKKELETKKGLRINLNMSINRESYLCESTKKCLNFVGSQGKATILSPRGLKLVNVYARDFFLV